MSIFKYLEYKRFLRAYIAEQPRKGRGVVSNLARHLGVSSTLVSQILHGDKHFSLEQAEGVTIYMGLSEMDTDYFLLLVHLARAGTKSLQQYYEKKITTLRSEATNLVSRVKPERLLTDQEKSVFYSSPLYTAIFLYTTLGDKGQSIEDICKRFELPRAKIVEVLRFLTETGICFEENGRYKMGMQSTHVEQGSPHLLNHYRNWRIRAIQQSETLSEEELMYTAAVSLSYEDFKDLREDMVTFIKEFLRRTHASPAEEIACFNLDFIWMKK